MTNTIYNYDSQNGEFVSESLADESPLEPGILLLPAYATDLKPPKVETREVPIFSDGAWQVKSDWRGVPLFSIADGSAVSTVEIGTSPADLGATELPPPSSDYAWTGSIWALDRALVALKTAALVTQTLEIARQMRLPIIGILDGMQSSALTEGDLPRAQAIEAAKLGLKNITKVDLSGCTTADEMRLVIMSAYLAIAKAAPDAVQTAFAQVLA